MPTGKKQGKYRSGFENRACKMLSVSNISFQYEPFKLSYIIPESHHTYTPDIVLSNGIICELKGYMDASTRKKMKMIVDQNPDKDIRMVFQDSSVKITKRSKTTYAMWADKNGIKWGTVEDMKYVWSKEPPSKTIKS